MSADAAVHVVDTNDPEGGVRAQTPALGDPMTTGEALAAVIAEHQTYLDSMADGDNDYTSAAFNLYALTQGEDPQTALARHDAKLLGQVAGLMTLLAETLPHGDGVDDAAFRAGARAIARKARRLADRQRQLAGGA